MTRQFQIRRATSAQWEAADPVLAAGEMGCDTDLTKVKVGDGATAWASLEWLGKSHLSVDGATVASSVAETSVLASTLDLPSGFAYPGCTFDVDVAINWANTSGSSSALTLRSKVAGITYVQAVPSSLATGANKTLTFSSKFLWDGTNIAIVASWIAGYGDLLTDVVNVSTVPTYAIDISSGASLDVTGQLDLSHANNTLTGVFARLTY